MEYTVLRNKLSIFSKMFLSTLCVCVQNLVTIHYITGTYICKICIICCIYFYFASGLRFKSQPVREFAHLYLRILRSVFKKGLIFNYVCNAELSGHKVILLTRCLHLKNYFRTNNQKSSISMTNCDPSGNSITITVFHTLIFSHHIHR
jgi:hypothetical protein